MPEHADHPDWPDLAELLETGPGEAMELNQRYLNPQLGRVVQTLGFDRDWVAGRGLAPDRPRRRTSTSTCSPATACSRSAATTRTSRRQLQGVLDADTPEPAPAGRLDAGRACWPRS